MRAPQSTPKSAIPDWVGSLLLRWSRKRVVLVVEDDALEAGALRFLNTPFDMKELLSTLTQAFGE